MLNIKEIVTFLNQFQKQKKKKKRGGLVKELGKFHIFQECKN